MNVKLAKTKKIITDRVRETERERRKEKAKERERESVCVRERERERPCEEGYEIGIEKVRGSKREIDCKKID